MIQVYVQRRENLLVVIVLDVGEPLTELPNVMVVSSTSEETVLEAIQLGQKTVVTVCEMIDELAEQVKPEKIEVTGECEEYHQFLNTIREKFSDRLIEVKGIPGKQGRNTKVDEIKEELSGNLCRCGTYPAHIKAILEAAKKLRGEV